MDPKVTAQPIVPPEAKDGWYAIRISVAGSLLFTPWENRRSIATMDGRDIGATHVGYFDGTRWEEFFLIDNA